MIKGRTAPAAVTLMIAVVLFIAAIIKLAQRAAGDATVKAAAATIVDLVQAFIGLLALPHLTLF